MIEKFFDLLVKYLGQPIKYFIKHFIILRFAIANIFSKLFSFLIVIILSPMMIVLLIFVVIPSLFYMGCVGIKLLKELQKEIDK